VLNGTLAQTGCIVPQQLALTHVGTGNNVIKIEVIIIIIKIIPVGD